ncbi:MAG TPA: MFS transporter [Vicinamibacterales bacterium]|nr:MFS transporter [Vicinamibacterales bacterium]
MLAWWNEGSSQARKALIAAGLGWMLDAFDVTLFAMALPAIRSELGLSPSAGGILGSTTLLAAAAGGVFFGRIADRYGRTRALMFSVAIYSVFTAACGFAQNFTHFLIFRTLLGIGMGGEWASGAALVSETWPTRHRGKALGLMQSGWAIGYAAAALVNGLVQPSYGWRAVFFVGILPAFFTLWVRRSVEEPRIWTDASRAAQRPASLASIFRRPLGALTLALTLMNTCTLFAWWGFYLWLPTYLTQSTAQGGVGLNLGSSSAFILVMQAGMWFGYVTFGFVSDHVGRKKTYVTYLLAAAVLLFVYVSVREPIVLLVLGPFVAFFATGYFSGFGAVTAEIYPTAIRASAQGFTYNMGRIVSAAAPWLVGSLAQTNGFGAALSVSSAAFLLAALAWFWIPETRGRELS